MVALVAVVVALLAVGSMAGWNAASAATPTAPVDAVAVALLEGDPADGGKVNGGTVDTIAATIRGLAPNQLLFLDVRGQPTFADDVTWSKLAPLYDHRGQLAVAASKSADNKIGNAAAVLLLLADIRVANDETLRIASEAVVGAAAAPSAAKWCDPGSECGARLTPRTAEAGKGGGTQRANLQDLLHQLEGDGWVSVVFANGLAPPPPLPTASDNVVPPPPPPTATGPTGTSTGNQTADGGGNGLVDVLLKVLLAVAVVAVVGAAYLAFLRYYREPQRSGPHAADRLKDPRSGGQRHQTTHLAGPPTSPPGSYRPDRRFRSDQNAQGTSDRLTGVDGLPSRSAADAATRFPTTPRPSADLPTSQASLSQSPLSQPSLSQQPMTSSPDNALVCRVHSELDPDGYVSYDGILYRARWNGSADRPAVGDVVRLQESGTDVYLAVR